MNLVIKGKVVGMVVSSMDWPISVVKMDGGHGYSVVEISDVTRQSGWFLYMKECISSL